jgi:hypothetical protein
VWYRFFPNFWIGVLAFFPAQAEAREAKIEVSNNVFLKNVKKTRKTRYSENPVFLVKN